MFQHTVSYDAAYLGKFPCFEEDLATAFAWAAERAGQLGCSITVVAPTRQHFRDGRLAKLPASVGQETPRTLGEIGHRAQPVVVSCWPTAKDLDQLDGLHSLKALVVVPWNEEKIDTWRRARGALDLLGRQPAPPAPTISDPVVEVALNNVTSRVNLSTGLSHPDDRSAAIQALQLLKRNGYQLQPDEIRGWAMANGWRADHARQLGEYATGVLAGRAYRTGRLQWKSQIIAIWRREAAEES